MVCVCLHGKVKDKFTDLFYSEIHNSQHETALFLFSLLTSLSINSTMSNSDSLNKNVK